MAQDSVGAPHVIEERHQFFLQQPHPRVFLVVDDLLDDFVQPGDDFALLLAERDLV